MSKAYDGSLRGLDPYVKEIIDLWLEEREGIQETDQPPPNVSFAGDDSSTLPEIQNRSFSPARDVAFRLLEGREESFLLFWKRTGNRYIAVEGPWAEAVHSLLERGTIASSLEILEASFESVNREEAIQDMQTLLSETIRMGFINPD